MSQTACSHLLTASDWYHVSFYTKTSFDVGFCHLNKLYVYKRVKVGTNIIWHRVWEPSVRCSCWSWVSGSVDSVKVILWSSETNSNIKRLDGMTCRFFRAITKPCWFFSLLPFWNVTASESFPLPQSHIMKRCSVGEAGPQSRETRFS